MGKHRHPVELFYLGVESLRLWSIHPKYLDCKGLVAVWREGLLAKKVLEGKTKGYRNHPELDRFKSHKEPLKAINTYLLYIWKEAKRRCYSFDKNKIGKELTKSKIKIGMEHIDMEFSLLKAKTKKRSAETYKRLTVIRKVELNPLFIAK